MRMAEIAILFLWHLLALAEGLSAPSSLRRCPGYRAINVDERSRGLTADLTLAGEPCNVYGTDIKHLKLEVEYQTGEPV